MNNIKPRTREEREAMKEKESIEKSRINQRVGYEAKHLYVKELLHFSDPSSDLYLPENERFDKDFASYDKKVREQKFLSKEMINEKHRIEALEREALKWERIEKEAEKELIKKDFHRQVLLAGKRNMNGSPFNPITLEYENSNKGQELKKRDEEAKVRAMIRADNIDSRSNCGYNVVTGEGRKGIEVPGHLKDQFDNKIKLKNEFYSWKPPQNK